MLLLSEQKRQVFEQCQRGAFNTSCTQPEREALKLINCAIDNAINVIITAGTIANDRALVDG